MSTICGWGHIGHNVRIFDPLVVLQPEMVRIFDYARVDAGARIEGGLGVTIGERCHVASGCRLNIGGGELVIGAHSTCSVNVVIATGSPDLSYLCISAAEESDDCHVIRKKTVISEYVVIFAGAIILPGLTIGYGSVIAAGAVLTHDVGLWEIWGGCPAVQIGVRKVRQA